MSLITRMRKQDAVYWPKVGDDAYGQPVYGLPQACKVRWEDVVEEFLNLEGRLELSNAKVYVDRDVTLGGAMWLGLLADADPSGNPFDNQGAAEVRKFDKQGNLRMTEFLRIAYLGLTGVHHGSSRGTRQSAGGS